MLAKGNYTVESITVLEKLNSDTDIVEVTFVGREEKAIMFHSYAIAMRFIGKQVYVEFRDELYQGEIRQCVNNITTVATVAVLDKEEVGKLYSEDVVEIGSNICFEDYRVGDIVTNAKVYCVTMSYGQSAKAEWAELIIMDRKRKQARLKVFDPEIRNVSLAGKYIFADIKLTKFGFNANNVLVEADATIEVNPDVLIAEKYILQILTKYPNILDKIEEVKLIDAIKNYNLDIRFEVGYLLVELAVQIQQALNLANLTNKLDIEALVYALILDKLYVLTDNEDKLETIDIQSFIKSLTLKGIPTKVRNIIAPAVKETFAERDIFFRIKDMTNAILDISRGV